MAKAGWLVYILRCADGTLYTGATNDLTGTQKFLKMPGQVNGSASWGQDGSGNGIAYHPTGAGYPGFAIVDTALAVPYRFGVDLSQLAGTTTADFYLCTGSASTSERR